jgi:hypothetical protein
LATHAKSMAMATDLCLPLLHQVQTRYVSPSRNDRKPSTNLASMCATLRWYRFKIGTATWNVQSNWIPGKGSTVVWRQYRRETHIVLLLATHFPPALVPPLVQAKHIAARGPFVYRWCMRALVKP